MSWYGYLWQHGQWQWVTGPHESLSACSRALERIAQARGVPGRLQVMTGSGPPRFVPAQPERSSAAASCKPLSVISDD